jgi:hypothetical protein
MADSLAERRYGVVSCHVERPLDDRVWALFERFQKRRPGGFAIAALLRPPGAGEDEARFVERARAAARRGPFGLHTHFAGAAEARPARPGPEHAELVRAQLVRLRGWGLAPTVFCGGGWYVDRGVAGVLAEAGLADCTATAFRPSYLRDDAPRLALDAPIWLDLGEGARVLELPSTHSLGMAARASLRPLRSPVLHVYFHDTDLLSPRRRRGLHAALALLGRRRRPTDLDRLRSEAAVLAPSATWESAARCAP